MSLDALLSVWKKSKQSGTKLIILMILADYADESGESWPGLKTIATRARLTSIDQASRHIQELEASGEITIVRNPGRGNHYHLNITVDEYIKSIPRPPAESTSHPPRKVLATPRETVGSPPAKSTNDSLNDSLIESVIESKKPPSVINILSKAAGFSAMPPLEEKRTEQILSMVDVYGEERVTEALKKNCADWVSRKTKDGRAYARTNMTWVDWAQNELDNSSAPAGPNGGLREITMAEWSKLPNDEAMAYLRAGRMPTK